MINKIELYLEDVLTHTLEENNLFDVKITGHSTNSSDYFNVQPRRLVFSMFTNSISDDIQLISNRLDTGLSKYELRYYQDGLLEMTGRIDVLKTKPIFKTQIRTFTVYDNLLLLKRVEKDFSEVISTNVDQDFLTASNNFIAQQTLFINQSDNSIDLDNETNATPKIILRSSLEVCNIEDPFLDFLEVVRDADSGSYPRFKIGLHESNLTGRTCVEYALVGSYTGVYGTAIKHSYYIKIIKFWNNICYEVVEWKDLKRSTENVALFDSAINAYFNQTYDELALLDDFTDSNRFYETITNGWTASTSTSPRILTVNFTGNVLNDTYLHFKAKQSYESHRKAAMLLHDWITYTTKPGVIAVETRNPGSYDNVIVIDDEDLIDSSYPLQGKSNVPLNLLSPLAGDLTLMKEIIEEETKTIFTDRKLINTKIDDKNYGLDLMKYVEIRSKYYQIQSITPNKKRFEDAIIGIEVVT